MPTVNGSMTPRELSENDDIATSLLVDPYLGFITHKMNSRHRPLKGRQREEMGELVRGFIKDQDYERRLNKILEGDWARSFFLTKTRAQQQQTKMHLVHYLRVYDKDAGFTIQSCNRYSMEDGGGMICASKKW
ncbi:PREDICTED: histone-lysine N-methyltransferase SUV420H1-A-like [Priapulus caudatus]|uniref:Histone-lysine N-methyltransferase SUV420H1-A-like n=1 Tax=Priapulus caudatus TaxID=37621 RepID=A0ABM1DQ23_PRICU|nr:PREDICTED: histone-lysine N-methyltransferase SUV420H1-A-like [Priapulus caudatus]